MFVKFNGVVTNEADLQKRVEQFKRDSETVVQGAEADFGQRVVAATQRRLSAHRGLATASRPAAPESFGQKIADAVKARTAGRERRPRSKSA